MPLCRIRRRNERNTVEHHNKERDQVMRVEAAIINEYYKFPASTTVLCISNHPRFDATSPVAKVALTGDAMIGPITSFRVSHHYRNL
ncbi:hypothetical protein Ccrd_019675 [Cynara cardunculus var. scolymus]|uniref:Uncharacterized protein n=1 Tax=Cynara cardunculus var. scolymus TaxID=59895 RepID=A0A124SF39_CYNCS|nr:hypothetical protein Ccrd_019675 [Cynara cardunculus var. scolymus]